METFTECDPHQSSKLSSPFHCFGFSLFAADHLFTPRLWGFNSGWKSEKALAYKQMSVCHLLDLTHFHPKFHPEIRRLHSSSALWWSLFQCTASLRYNPPLNWELRGTYTFLQLAVQQKRWCEAVKRWLNRQHVKDWRKTRLLIQLGATCFTQQERWGESVIRRPINGFEADKLTRRTRLYAMERFFISIAIIFFVVVFIFVCT